MQYIIESIYSKENAITIYYKNNLQEAKTFSRFLNDKYNVDTEIYTEDEYMKLHPEKFNKDYSCWLSILK